MLKMVKGGKGKPGVVEGEVQFGVNIRNSMVMLTIVSPADEQPFVVGIAPDGASQLAVAMDEAAEAIRNGQTDSSAEHGDAPQPSPEAG
jgi:hypothetical protein